MQWAHARSRARYIHTIPQCGNYHSIAPQGNLRPCVSVSGIPAPVCRLALLQPAREGACFSPGETHALAACGDCAGETHSLDIDVDIDHRGHHRLLHRKPAIEIEIETETEREANTKEDEQRARACATRLETIGHCIAPRNGAAQPCPRPGPRPR